MKKGGHSRTLGSTTHQVWLYLLVHRLECRDCGALSWPHLPFADPRSSYTSSFERMVLELLQFATIAAYRSLVLNYFDHPISSGKIEGINNKIKTLKRQAYGFRDMGYFRLRLFHLYEQT